MVEFLRTWEIVKETNITERPPIPKIKHTCTRQAMAGILRKQIRPSTYIIKAQKLQKLSLTEVHELFYSSGSEVCDTLGIKVRSKTQKKPKVPIWKRRIEKDIQKIRGEVSIPTEILQGSGEEKKSSYEKI